MKTLLIVDLQKDFYHPDGALYVPGAEVIPGRLVQLMPAFDQVVFTLDWHPAFHSSFKPYGGIWPVHCVQHSAGASLPQEVLEAAGRRPCHFYLKGQDAGREEYGAFEQLTPEMRDVLAGSDELLLCGLCGDYCVGETAKNLFQLGLADHLAVSLACTGSLDGGESLQKRILKHHIPTR